MKGEENLKNHHQAKSQRVREQRGGVPDISELRKAEEDKNYGVWEKYLVKTSEVEKSKAR